MAPTARQSQVAGIGERKSRINDLIQMKSISIRNKLISLLDEILPLAQFYARERPFFSPPDSMFLDVDGYRKEFERIKSEVLWQRRMPVPSDFIRPHPDLDRFSEEHFDRLVAVVGQLLDPYTGPDNHRFMAVLPAPRVYQSNLGQSVGQFSKSIVRCAAVLGVAETVDALLRLANGDTARYTQVVVLDGVIPSPREEGVELWPGARLIEWDHAFGDRLGESMLGIPDAVLTQADHADANSFTFGRSATLLCIDHEGGPIIRCSEDAEPGAGGPYIPVSPHQFSTEIAISALALTVNHPIVEVCSWHWFDSKVQYLLGYRNELALDQNIGGPQPLWHRLLGAEDAPFVRKINEGLSQEGIFDKLRVPIQRWRRSKAASNGVDLAIDLRIALESLFLDDGNRGELSFRLALRAAWYLGTEGDERTEIFEAVRNAYDIGSKAVHTGEGYDQEIHVRLAVAQDICRASILRRIDEGGKPPDWKKVVLEG